MLVRSVVAYLWLQTAAQPSIESKLFTLLVAALYAILHSTFFWFLVAWAFVSWWVSSTVRDAVRDGVKEAIQGLDLKYTIREAVGEAIRKAKEEERDDRDWKI